MLRNFTAALLATTLIAGPALAAQSTGTAGSTPATQAAPAAHGKQTAAVKPATSVKPMVKHAAKHSRKHLVRGKSGTMHQARHIKPAKTHQAKVSHQVRISHNAVKSAKPVDG